jgi:hypothetical protein
MAQDSFLEFYNRSDSKILISSFKELRNKYYNKTAEKILYCISVKPVLILLSHVLLILESAL